MINLKNTDEDIRTYIDEHVDEIYQEMLENGVTFEDVYENELQEFYQDIDDMFPYKLFNQDFDDTFSSEQFDKNSNMLHYGILIESETIDVDIEENNNNETISNEDNIFQLAA